VDDRLGVGNGSRVILIMFLSQRCTIIINKITHLFRNLIAKNYRIYKIFTTTTANSVSKLNDKDLLLYFGVMLLMELVLLIIWTAVETPIVQIDKESKWKYCSGNDNVRNAVISYNVLLLVATTFLAVKTRHAYERFSDTKVLGITVSVSMY
jgi:hypothetical protein